MVSVDPGLLFVQLLTFGLAVLVLWRFFWKPLAQFMKRRAEQLATDIRDARRLRQDADELKAMLADRMSDSDAKAQAMLQLAVEEGGRKRDEILNDAEAEAKRLIEAAGHQIAEERRRLARELRGETVALAMLIAERALQQSIDPKVQERLVHEFAEKLKND